MNKVEKLQRFIELAYYVDGFMDVSDEENISKAGKWLNEELTFLDKYDLEELKIAWNIAIEDGRYIRTFINFVKILQEKYE